MRLRAIRPTTRKVSLLLGALHDDRERSGVFRIGGLLWFTALPAGPLDFLLPRPFDVSVPVLVAAAIVSIALGCFGLRAAASPPADPVAQLLALLGIGSVGLGMWQLGGSVSPGKYYLVVQLVFVAWFFRSPTFLVAILFVQASPLIYEPGAWSNGAGIEIAFVAPLYSFVWAFVVHVKRQLLDLRDQAERRGVTDPLTGLINRRGFDEAMSRSGDDSGTLLYIDLDHFKRLNDQHGHETGDAALQAVADAMRHTLRSDDLSARLGGEEFVAWLHATDTTSARRVADRLREIARQTLEDRHAIALTMSIGVATGRRSDITDLVRRADAAMYDAKTGGRDRVVVSAPVPISA